MTDDEKSEEARKPEPQVIDLDAEEVREDSAEVTQETAEAEPVDAQDSTGQVDAEPAEPEEQPAETSPPPPSPPPKKSHRTIWFVVAALVIGLAAGGWVYRDLLANYLPTNEMTAMKDRLDVIEANAKTTGEQLLAVSQKADDAAKAATEAETAAKTVASGLANAGTRIDGVEQRIASLEDALKAAASDLDELRTAVSAGTGTGSGTGTVDTAALAALGQRIDALEKDVASLKAGAGDRTNLTTELSQALSDLKAKIAAGTPFAAEYDRIARMVPAAPGLDVLASHAAVGLPTAQGLAEELKAAIPALPQPETPSPVGDGYWDQFVGLVSGIITVRDIGDTNWPELAQNCVSLAEAGDLTQAIALIEQAEGTKPQALNQWHDRAAARLRLEAALGQVSEAVVRQITALGGAQ